MRAELRNRIYKFLTDGDETRVNLVLRADLEKRIYKSLMKNNENTLMKPPPKPKALDWHGLQQQTLGLTQTSRELRQEFLPLQRRHTTHVVDLEHLPGYVETHLTGTFKDNSKVVGSVSVDLDRRYERSHQTNMMTLLRMCAAAHPHLIVKFKHEEDGQLDSPYCRRIRDIAKGLQTLFVFERDSQWARYFRDAVVSMSIRVWRADAICLKVYLRPGYDHEICVAHNQAEKWGHFAEQRRLCEKWEKRAGLHIPSLRYGMSLYSMGPGKSAETVGRALGG